MGQPTARERAFEALLPVALAIESALARADASVAKERKQTQATRAGFNRAQRAGLEGSCRFAASTVELGRALEGRPGVVRLSTTTDESQNIFRWAFAEGLVIRVKHDLSDVVDPGTTRLIEFDVPAAQTAFITWEVSGVGSIRNVRFACVDEPSWTIPLAQLVAAAQAAIVPVNPAKLTGPAVRSTRPRHGRSKDAAVSHDLS